MTFVLLLVAIVILLCVMAEKFSGKFGMPALILFMFIGMLFGSDGIFYPKLNWQRFQVQFSLGRYNPSIQEKLIVSRNCIW